MLKVKDYYDVDTGTFTYLIYCDESSESVVIDPVLKYDVVSGHISEDRIAPIIADINTLDLQLTWILETHAHADHLTAAQQLKDIFNAKIGIGRGIVDIQHRFKGVYGFDDNFDTTGNAFDELFQDGDNIDLGTHEIKVLATPGHTPDSISYEVGNYLFIGDTLFHPSIGTARCDFPGGNAALLFETIERLLAYPDDTVLCLCHDYPEEPRNPEAYITVAEMRKNIHLVSSHNQQNKFVEIRQEKDECLELPKLIIPSIQVNVQAGLNKASINRSLVWPINRF